MINYLSIFIFTPLIGLLLSFLPSNKQEKWLFGITVTAVSVQLIALLTVTLRVMIQGGLPLFDKGWALYQTETADFSLSLFCDSITLVYSLVAGIITFLVTIFSRYFLHREKGYKRFFNNLLFFYLGLQIILFSGNFETLFIGWEIIGITSFFLIAFYRDRYLPVKNALKVVSLYRLADILLLLGIWICHHVFAKTISFQVLYDLEAHHIAIIRDPMFQLAIPTLFWVVALIKSAQVPFSSWLPRAMEGPTTSSAIFYGSLSVHIGLFLMLRTYPFWEHNIIFKSLVILVSLVTIVITTTIARVQSSVKTQIAYSSIAQIGIMFIEVALGWHILALVHFTCNAFLRTFQLLVSPSVLHYLIHDQFYNFNPPQKAGVDSFWDKIKLTVYMLSLKEWNLDFSLYQYIWMPLKKAGNLLHFMSVRVALWIFAPLFLVGLYGIYHQTKIPISLLHHLATFCAFIGIVLILKSFTERGSALGAWLLIVLNQLFTSLSVGFNEEFDYSQVYIFLSGIFVSAIVGFGCLWGLRRKGEDIHLQKFHGHAYEHPYLTNIFLLACMGLSGFPITPTFIGEDLILGHIHETQIGLTFLTALNLILGGLAIFRIYTRICLGPHEKTYHEVAYRSS